jgi:hypothetical protein
MTKHSHYAHKRDPRRDPVTGELPPGIPVDPNEMPAPAAPAKTAGKAEKAKAAPAKSEGEAT